MRKEKESQSVSYYVGSSSAIRCTVVIMKMDPEDVGWGMLKSKVQERQDQGFETHRPHSARPSRRAEPTANFSLGELLENFFKTPSIHLQRPHPPHEVCFASTKCPSDSQGKQSCAFTRV